MKRSAPTNEPLTEALSDRAARVNLGAWKAAGLTPEWLFSLFIKARAQCSEKDEDAFFHDDDMSELVKSGASLDTDAWQSHFFVSKSGRARCVAAVSGSRIPRLSRAVVPRARLVPSCRHCRRFQKDGPVVIALDGRAASGKSTAAAILSEALGAGVVAMDDFFLPPELRTPERLSQPGGEGITTASHAKSCRIFQNQCVGL